MDIEDNDMCAARWIVPQRHVIERRLRGSAEARLRSVVCSHVNDGDVVGRPYGGTIECVMKRWVAVMG